MTNSSRRRGWLTLSRARRSRRLPGAWRLWILGLFVASLGPAVVYALPLLALVALIVVWENLSNQVSIYADHSLEWEGRSTAERLFGFLAGLAAACGFVFLFLISVAEAMDVSAARPVPIILVAISLGCVLAWRVVAAWWHFLPWLVAAAAVTGTAFGSLAITFQTEAIAPASTAWAWFRCFLRLAAAFTVAGAVAWMRKPKRQQTWSMNSVLVVVQTMAFLGLLALVAPRERKLMEASALEGSLWYAVIGGLGLAAVGVASQAWLPMARDWQWYRRHFRKGFGSAGPPPADVLVSLALVPSLALAAIASWSAWLIAFGLGVASAIFKVAAEPREKRRPHRLKNAATGPASAAAR